MTLTGCGGSSNSDTPSAEGTSDNSPDTAQASIYWQVTKSGQEIPAGTESEFFIVNVNQILTNVPLPRPFYGVETEKESDESIRISNYDEQRHWIEQGSLKKSVRYHYPLHITPQLYDINQATDVEAAQTSGPPPL